MRTRDHITIAFVHVHTRARVSRVYNSANDISRPPRKVSIRRRPPALPPSGVNRVLVLRNNASAITMAVTNGVTDRSLITYALL